MTICTPPCHPARNGASRNVDAGPVGFVPQVMYLADRSCISGLSPSCGMTAHFILPHRILFFICSLMKYHVYIMASSIYRAIYIGVTNDVARRVAEHRADIGSKHVTQYKIYKLVYVTSFDDINEAIHHEKKLKRWKRPWKDALIEESNPGWYDISGEFWSEN